MWVVDAPLFEPADDATAAGDVAVGSGAWTAVHHAFTSPKPESLDTFDTDPGAALAYAYDIVCNGNEIGGGSIRIHREDVQRRVFAVMGLSEAEAQEKFGFLLQAFKYGAPPHGGIAFGWDRICALLARHRLDPRRHRLPEDRGRLRPADRGPGADHAGAAQGGRRRRPPGPRPPPTGAAPSRERAARAEPGRASDPPSVSRSLRSGDRTAPVCHIRSGTLSERHRQRPGTTARRDDPHHAGTTTC